MKVEEVEKLLDAFYEGTATECEEEKLKVYFQTGDVPEHLHKDRALFLALCREHDTEVPTGLAEILGCLIDEKAETEQQAIHHARMRRDWRWIGGIAATLILLVGISYSICNNTREMQPPTPQDTFSDPKEAYEVLHSTLTEVSTHLNEGVNQVTEVQKEVRKINREAKNK